MKTTINIVKIAFLLLVVAGFTSCLKDKNGITNYTDAGTPPQIAELPTNGFSTVALDLTPTPDTLKVNVNVTSSEPLTSPVTVTLALDQAGLDAYNAANGTSFTMLDASAFSIPNYKVTIPAGSNLSALPVIIYPSKVDLSKNNALALKITDAQGRTLSANAQSVIYSVLIKNQYEGWYHSTGYFQHPTAPRAIDRDKYLSTVNANTVEMELGDIGTPIDITINPDNTITTLVPQGGSNAGTHLISGDPVYNNTYDPATHTFWLKYGYPTSPTRIITEKVTLK